jgi:CPA2 family monovalent cation:H+ antiporter-2
MALSVASTVVLVRVLSDNNDLHTPAGHVAVGWLVVEDLFTVVALVVLPALFGGKESGGGLALALLMTALKIGLLVGVTFAVGGWLIPWLLARVAETKSRELFTLTVLVIALGIAVGSAKLFGVSMALGAFLAGMVVGRSDFSLRAATEALPMRDAFAVLFFVSTGMLFDPRFLLQAPALIAATLGIVVLGKPLAALTIVLLLRYPLRVALAVSVALAQVGEFTFMLAVLGNSLGVSPDPNPDTGALDRHRAVVVGYGPVGRTLSRILRENHVEPAVIEMNLETVRLLREEGVEAVYGDASHRGTLEAAGVARSDFLVLSSSGLRNAEEIIRLARELNPKVEVLARCSYLRERSALSAAGADVVLTGEGEVALSMAESMLERLGAFPEQIDRERDRVREELFGDEPPTRG